MKLPNQPQNCFISDQFDSGNIDVINCQQLDNIQLAIKQDSASEFFQWFYFRISNVSQQNLTIHIVNASEAAYARGWNDYQCCYSYDQITWQRCDTHYDDKQLTIALTAKFDHVYFAYFAPYTYERHLNKLSYYQRSKWCTERVLGQTAQGRDLSLLEISDQSQQEKLAIWLIARQHPGESMAQWFMEGLISRLVETTDALSQALLKRCNFYCVPNMNPDGTALGNLRVNSLGANLNRFWQQPDPELAIEVTLVRQAIHDAGADFFFDVHGDEALPYNFTAGGRASLNYNEARASRDDSFLASYMTVSPEMQNQHGYPATPKGRANLGIAANYIAETFGCLALTLEMPFKDNALLPNPDTGWSPQRAQQLGRDLLPALWANLDQLKAR